MAVAVSLHILAAIAWVGGMFFAILVLRPAAGPLEPPERLALWRRVFARFFPWVWISLVLLLGTGNWIIIAGFGGFADLPLHIHLMHGIGWLMALLYLHLWFAPYKRFTRYEREAAAAVRLDFGIFSGFANTEQRQRRDRTDFKFRQRFIEQRRRVDSRQRNSVLNRQTASTD